MSDSFLGATPHLSPLLYNFDYVKLRPLPDKTSGID